MSIKQKLFINRGRSGLILVGALTLLTIAASALAKNWLLVPARHGTPAGLVAPAPVLHLPAPALSPQVKAESADGKVHVGAVVDRAAMLRGGDGEVRVQLQLSADALDGAAVRRPTDVVVVLDRSGSMSGTKLEAARIALLGLLDNLSGEDRFALVTYESGARVDIPLAVATADVKRGWRSVIGRLDTAGGTNMSAGLDLATPMFAGPGTGRARRMLLLSDGHANEGDPSLEGLGARAGRAVPGEYVISTIGVGEGFNETLMSRLADRGTGNYYYLDGEAGLGQIISQEFDSARQTLASSVAVTFSSERGVEVLDAAGYPIENAGGIQRFHVGSLYAGQVRKLWLTLRARPTGERLELGTFRVEYTQDGAPRQLELAQLPTLDVVSDREAFFAGLNSEAWGEAVGVDAYNKMRTEVAALVQRGEKEEAQKAIAAWRTRYEAMNAAAPEPSPAVSEAVDQARQLESEVGSVFDGPDVAEKKNHLSKRVQSSSIKARRAGSYR